MPSYTIRRTAAAPAVGKWDDPSWQKAGIVEINHFYQTPRASDHRPVVRARFLHDDRGIHALYDVQDRYVVCLHTKYQEMVCRDSCVEFFLWPRPTQQPGYFNFEINCGGNMLLYFIEDARTGPDGEFMRRTQVADSDLELVKIDHSLPKVVKPELTGPTHWWMQAFIPWKLFETYAGRVTPASGTTWRGNFYKCADESSHPHWASWAVVGGSLNFHKPEYFGEVHFE